MKNNYRALSEDILALAGVNINGNNPWDIKVTNEDFYKRALTEGELGVGESYMKS
jgi:cyclopropane-fatty-acyl-phospholipid synthase